MNDPMTQELDNFEPTSRELAAIDAEWPLIAAELELVGAECRLARTPNDAVAQRSHRRAVRSLLSLLRDTPTTKATGRRPGAA